MLVLRECEPEPGPELGPELNEAAAGAEWAAALDEEEADWCLGEFEVDVEARGVF